MGWVLGETWMPDHRDGMLGDLEWHSVGHQRSRCGAFAEAGWRGEDEVALLEDFEGRREVRNAQRDAAFEALRLKDAIDDAGALASW